MQRSDYLLRKIGFAIATLVVVVIFNFFLFRVLPGDPVKLIIHSPRMTAEAQEKLALFAPLLCAVNDRWFAGMSRLEMRTASEFMQRLIGQYDSAIIKAQDMRNDLS